ncbi:hypothetical protein EX30DRAFT_372542 [Ascodesmis nigricans]|uniref:Transcription factor domain-containing protein n=1 Tax=Ascodesmis nigricans TaxID=341454 RepID=A0A4S2MU62_9PEZI|nr:hypothetical protein EX30DRAFT_372542 [Ascodesmis nigricans]
MSAITGEVCGSQEPVDLNTIRTFSDRLKAWHTNLPEDLTLASAVRGDCDSANRTAILLIHCAYLGSIILLTRRTYIETIVSRTSMLDGPFSPSETNEGKEAETYSGMCITAAKQLATVVEILRAENRLTRRCWLLIQSAYTAGIIISLDVASRRGRPTFESAFKESMSLIERCITVLSQCGTFDVVAEGLAKILQPIHDTLSKPAMVPGTRRSLYSNPYAAGSPRMPTNEELLAHIVDLLKRPYGGEGTIMDFDNFGIHQQAAPANYRFATDSDFPAYPGNGHATPGSVDSVRSTSASGGHRAVIMAEFHPELAGGRAEMWRKQNNLGHFSSAGFQQH